MAVVQSYDREKRVPFPLRGSTNPLRGLGFGFLYCLLSLSLWAPGRTQPLFTVDDIPSTSGLESHYSVVTGGSLAVDLGSVGGPQMWDYGQVSEADAADTVVERIVEAGDTPFDSLFPEANLVHQTDALNFIGTGTTSGYQYWNLDEASLSLLGMGADSVFGVPFAFAFDSPFTSVPLPLELGIRWSDGTTFTDIFRIENPAPGQLPGDSVDVKIEIEYAREGKVEGWGTVSVPHGEYEALRVRRHDTTHFDLSVWIFFGFTSVFDTTLVVYTYDWFVENLGSVLTITSRPNETDTLFSVATSVRRLIRTSTPEAQPGDVNCDGQITPGDALCTFWRAIQGSFEEECQCPTSEAAAEVTCDGAITPGDALCIFWRSILGEWTEECQCTPLAKYDTFDNQARRLWFGSINEMPGGFVKVPIVADMPEWIDAFGLDMTYPADLFEFHEVVTTPATRDWIALEAAQTGYGILTVGGFHTEKISGSESAAIAEVVFRVKGDDGWGGQFGLTHFVDDLRGAHAEKGDCIAGKQPHRFHLWQNIPNPFNPTTDIRYQIGDGGFPVNTTLKVYNIMGQEIRSLFEEAKEPGSFTVTWDGRDDSGRPVSSGIYFSVLRAGSFSATKKMILMK